jgi:hypothetical protein
MRLFFLIIFLFSGFSSALTSQELLYYVSIQPSSEASRVPVPFSLASDGLSVQFTFTSSDGTLYTVAISQNFYKFVLSLYPPPSPEHPCDAIASGLTRCRDVTFQPVTTPNVQCTTFVSDNYGRYKMIYFDGSPIVDGNDDPDTCLRVFGGKAIAPYYKYGDNSASRAYLARIYYVINHEKPTLADLRSWGLDVKSNGVSVAGDFGPGDYDPTKTFTSGSAGGGSTGGGSTGGGTAGPPVPPVDPNDPFKPGSQSACAGKFSNLSWFEGALAKWFMPCRDWQADITALKDKAVLAAPLGFLKWLPPNEDQNHAIACARLSFAVQIMYETAVVTPMCSTVGQAYLSYIRPLFAYILYAALVAFMFRTVMR